LLKKNIIGYINLEFISITISKPEATHIFLIPTPKILENEKIIFWLKNQDANK